MREVSPATKELARRLLVHEAGGRQAPADLAEATERAFQRLRQRLARLIGLAGFNALLARALRLAQADFPALERVAFDEHAGTGLTGARQFATAAAGDPAEAGAALVAVLAQFIGLLKTFIGEDLGVRLVREAWPDLTAGGMIPPGWRQEHGRAAPHDDSPAADGGIWP